jgi:hypothetical protein
MGAQSHRAGGLATLTALSNPGGPEMIDMRARKHFLPLGLLFFSGVSLLALTGCKAGHSPGAEAAATAADTSKPAPAPDLVAEAHERGRQWALINKAVLVTDCGALTDEDERFGCADYINHLDH